MERTYHVVFTGQLHFGFNRDDTVDRMATLFQLDRQKVTKLLSSGRPTIMKQGLSWNEARKYRDRLEKIGLRMTVIEADARHPLPPPDPSPPAVLEPPPAVATTEGPIRLGPPPFAPPPSPAIEIQNEERQDDNEQEDDEADDEADDEETPPEEETLPYDGNPPYKISSSNGWLWIKEAFGMLFRQPLRWAAIMVVFSSIVAALAVIRYGVLLSTFLLPLLNGGIMLGAHHQKEEGELRIIHLFHGFSRIAPPLLLIGFLCLIFLILQTIVSVVCVRNITAGISSTPDSPEALAAVLRQAPLYWAGLLALVLSSIPLTMSIWFAPCLVALDDQPVFSAFRLSLKAVWINFSAFLVYGLVFMLLGLLFLFFYGAVAALFSVVLGTDHSFLFMLLPVLSTILLGILLSAVLPLSVYTGYRDIFHGREDRASEE